mmetsp:Transcript_28482/g.39645  ORF Transcript_28482/g.39645 Transcript_28482/m.39645 type:complete len:107 (+) Transcript_28482:3007-3327(+)
MLLLAVRNTLVQIGYAKLLQRWYGITLQATGRRQTNKLTLLEMTRLCIHPQAATLTSAHRFPHGTFRADDLGKKNQFTPSSKHHRQIMVTTSRARFATFQVLVNVE